MITPDFEFWFEFGSTYSYLSALRIEDVAGAILDSLGQPGTELIEQAQAPQNKQRLRDQTRRAAELGIFGAPSFVIGEELFWGDDRLEDALLWQRSYDVSR
ncbi:MAG: DsbA family protein [Actinobacteria bacterium]|nr:DsbA family protein [Actinomycetota bacterium]